MSEDRPRAPRPNGKARINDASGARRAPRGDLTTGGPWFAHDRSEATLLAHRAADARFTPEALMRLPRFEAYGHLTVEDDRREPAWFRVPPPPAQWEDADALVDRLLTSGRAYTRPRREVEAELSRRDALLDRGEPEVLPLDANDDPFQSDAA